MKLISGLVGLVVRLALLPFKVALGLLGITFKVGTRVGTAPVRVGWRLTRAAGVSGVVCFVLGAVVALLLAPFPGKDLRALLRYQLSSGGADAGGGDLGLAGPGGEVVVTEVETVVATPDGVVVEDLVVVEQVEPGEAPSAG